MPIQNMYRFNKIAQRKQKIMRYVVGYALFSLWGWNLQERTFYADSEYV